MDVDICKIIIKTIQKHWKLKKKLLKILIMKILLMKIIMKNEENNNQKSFFWKYESNNENDSLKKFLNKIFKKLF